MLKRFEASEILIVAMVIILIFVSEYYYIILQDPDHAIFIGLWPPTIMGLLIFFNMKKQ